VDIFLYFTSKNVINLIFFLVDELILIACFNTFLIVIQDKGLQLSRIQKKSYSHAVRY